MANATQLVSGGVTYNVKDSISRNGLCAWFIIGTYPDRYVTYNTDTKVLVLPPDCAVYYQNNQVQIPSQYKTLDLSSFIPSQWAASIWVTNQNTIVATAYNTKPYASLEPGFLGYVYGENVALNGVYNERIQIVNNAGMQYPQNGKIGGGSGVVVHEGVYQYGDFGDVGSVIYDRTNNKITLSSNAYCVYRGITVRNRPMTIDLSVVPGTTADFYAFKLFIKPDGTIYPTSWNANPQSLIDDFIGYGYNSILWINGVPQFAIEEASQSKTVYCFGDSIVAGHNTSEIFHMIYHKWDRNIHCKNYGVGGSGYAYSNPNGTTPNGIEYKYRDQDLVTAPADNTVLGMMQYVDSAMDNILIFAGTNDYGTSRTESAFRTGVQNALDYALTKTQKVFVITPIKRNYPSQSGETPNSVGMKLSDYAAIIKEECASRGIICVDGYEIGLDPVLPRQRQAFVPDGLHPNKNGHFRMARYTYTKFREALCV